MPIDNPPIDDNGHVIPHDHHQIEPDDWIIRRVNPDQHVVVDEKAPGGKKISSMLFNASSEPPGGMSTDIQKLIEEAGLDARVYVQTPVFTGAIRLRASAFRDNGFQVGFDPLATNPYHGEVWGKFTGGKKKALLRASEWFVQIDSVALSV